jgi:hypothetical protein
MEKSGFPDKISPASLLAALASRAHANNCERSLYETQLRHRLSTLSQKLQLVVAAQEASGISGDKLIGMTVEQLLALLDSCRLQQGKDALGPLRHFL